ncbi:hypothetical protein CLV35_0698 [Motilibacter peucedani]|uniref:Cell wall-active antibiotic response 4TMS protein YvqF n=1 Tax=Motilibacter peucedani TaxID=598650 RepID=A0A420XTS7_9ACTN|nr:hypothetical protein [Motilibacter peucedani]RKS80272.1 hypothetical protein CLV35_0698 [Motilibacter peucedani]
MGFFSMSTTGSTSRHLALLGGLRRSGTWEVPPRLQVFAAVGGADLDLTQATLPPVTEITKISLVGGLRVRVPAHVRVEVEGFSLVGPRPSSPVGPAAGPDVPVVRLRAYGAFGGVAVVTS